MSAPIKEAIGKLLKCNKKYQIKAMQLYKIEKDNLVSPIKEIPFKLEKQLQSLLEKNLTLIFNLEFVKSEFQIKDKRIDTLAFDPQTKSFVIIEYKRDRNVSVFDQGITYLNLMLQNKAEFIIEYNEALNKKLKRHEVDWTQTRVIFVSKDFTDFQIQATNFRDIAIELWTVKKFENNTLVISPIKKSKIAESIKLLSKQNKEIEIVTKEIKTYSEEDFLKDKSDEIIDLYNKFKDAILNLSDNIEIKPQKTYIAFKKNNKNISDIQIQKSSLRIYINVKSNNLDDPKNLSRDISQIGHNGNGDFDIQVSDTKNLEYIMSLIKQTPYLS